MRLEITTPRIVPVSNMGTTSSIEKPTIHIVHILDGSGSMGPMDMRGPSKFDSAKAGMFEEITLLKADSEVNYLYSIIEFSDADTIVKVCDTTPIKDIDFSKLPFFSPRSQTALYDAVSQTLRQLLFEYKPDVKVLVKIFTDGGENGSVRFGKGATQTCISKAKNRGFVITFVGTNQDVEIMQKQFSLDKNDTLGYDGSSEGLKQAYNVSNIATMAYSKSVVRGEETRGFFNNKN